MRVTGESRDTPSSPPPPQDDAARLRALEQKVEKLLQELDAMRKELKERKGKQAGIDPFVAEPWVIGDRTFKIPFHIDPAKRDKVFHLLLMVSLGIFVFAYLQNTVLVVCFMGLGMGCLTCRKPVRVREMLWPLLMLTLLLAVPITRSALGGITEMLTVLGDFVIWAQGASTSPLQSPPGGGVLPTG